jgi:hypothetical protein
MVGFFKRGLVEKEFGHLEIDFLSIGDFNSQTSFTQLSRLVCPD